MLPVIVSQAFGAHLREPAGSSLRGQADRAAEMTRSPASRPSTTGPVAYALVRQRWLGPEQVERGERGDELGGRGEQERLLGVQRDSDRVTRRRRRGARRCRSSLAGRPEPRSAAATAGGIAGAADTAPAETSRPTAKAAAAQVDRNVVMAGSLPAWCATAAPFRCPCHACRSCAWCQAAAARLVIATLAAMANAVSPQPALRNVRSMRCRPSSGSTPSFSASTPW